MSLQMVFGPDQQATKRHVIEQIDQWLQHHPQSKVYYIVPDHMKFDMENFVLQTLQEKYQLSSMAILNIQVVSFTRLAWYLMPEKVNQDTHISEIGMNMLLHQVMQENASQLFLLRKHLKHHGFIEKLQTLFHEFYQGHIDSSSLKALSQTLEHDDIEQQKIAEINLLFEKFLDKIQGNSLMNYQLFHDIQSYIQTHDKMQKVAFVIDHYYYFNQLQYGIIDAILSSCAKLWVCLPMEYEVMNQEEKGMYQTPWKTQGLLKAMAHEKSVDIDEDIYVQANQIGYQEDILKAAKIIKHLINYHYDAIEESNNPSQSHELWYCDSIQTELTRVSNQIYQLVHRHEFRYKDIVIMTRDLDTYARLLPKYLTMNQIPYFIDHTQTMLAHPFSKWLKAFFHLHIYRWKYEDIMTLLKIGLIRPDFVDSSAEYDHILALLENYILAHGYDRYRFYDRKFMWDEADCQERYINHLGQTQDISRYEVFIKFREWMIRHFYEPFKDLPKSATGKHMAQWLYDTLMNIGIQSALENQRDQLIKDGDVENSKKIEQIWNMFTKILDEFYTLYGDETLNFDEFNYFMQAGFKGATFHIIPPTMDQVMVTSIESPQVQRYKILFALDVNHHQLPKIQQNESLLSDTVRESFQDLLLPYQSIISSTSQNNRLEGLLTSHLFQLAQNRMYITLNIGTADGADALSPYLKQWLQYQEVPQFYFRNQEPFAVDHASNMGSSQALYGQYIAYVSHHIRQHKTITDHLKYLGTAIHMSSPRQVQEEFVQIFQQMFSLTHLPNKISEEVALKLFGSHLTSSISKMEMYYQDPYSYFLKYGLKLQERETLALDPLTTGNFIHDVLDHTVQHMIDNHWTWKDLSVLEFSNIRDRMMEQILTDTSLQILMAKPQTAFQLQQVMNLIKEYTVDFLQMSQVQNLMPIKSELIFGQRQSAEIPGKSFILPNQSKLSLTGKIDRIDQVVNASMIQVVDYKSGNKEFNLKNLYYGLDLQIMTYYLLAKDALQSNQAIGGFYHSLKHHLKNGTQEHWQMIQAGIDPKQKVTQKFSGFLTLNPQELQHVQANIMDAYDTSPYPVKIKKDGTYYSHVDYFDEATLQIIEKYIYYLYQKAGKEILSGNIALQPYKESTHVLSKQKEYRVITGFDATEDFNVYRRMTLTKEEVIQQMIKDLEEEGLDDSSAQI